MWFRTIALCLGLTTACVAASGPWTENPAAEPVLESGQATNVGVLGGPGGKSFVTTNFALNGELVNGVLRRLNPDGSTDHAFVPPIGSPLTPVAAYGDGRVLALRQGSDSTGTGYDDLVRLNADGSLDSAFAGVRFSDWVSVTILSDGRLIARGGFSKVNGQPMARMIVIDADGTLSTTFAPQFDGFVNAVLQQPDGKIVTGGSFTHVDGQAVPGIVRFNSDGSKDATFQAPAATNSNGLVSLYAGANGSILYQDNARSLFRLTANGTADATFAASTLGTVQAFGQQQPDGKILYVTNNSAPGPEIRRINANGTADAAFVVPTVAVSDFSPQPSVGADGTLYVVNPLTSSRSDSGNQVSRVLADGTIDTAYAPRTTSAGTARTVLLLPGGKMLIAGQFSNVNGERLPTSSVLYRFNADGRTDPTFKVAVPQGTIDAMWQQPSGAIIARGTFTAPGGTVGVLRFNADGSIDSSFPNVGSGSYSFTVDATGAIYTTTNSNTKLVRYTANGVPDSTFQSTLTGPVGMIMPMPDGTVVVTHSEPDPYSPGTRLALARVRSDGSVDPAFDVPVNNFAWNASILGGVGVPGGDLLVFGEQSQGGGNTIPQVWRISAAGAARLLYTGHLLPSTTYSPLSDLGGVLYDVCNEGGGTSAFLTQVTLAGTLQASIAVDSEGTMRVRRSTAWADPTVHAYDRTAAPAPSFAASPKFIYQPRAGASSYQVGSSITLDATVSGLEPIAYQWYRDGTAVGGATTSTLWIRSAAVSDSGAYTLTATNAYGSATSNPATITVNPPIVPVTITASPQSLTVTAGQSATFSVTAAGTAPFRYQWQRGGQNLSGATDATLTLSSVTAADAGNYTVVVQNGSSGAPNMATSAVAVLTVTPVSGGGSSGGSGGTGGSGGAGSSGGSGSTGGSSGGSGSTVSATGTYIGTVGDHVVGVVAHADNTADFVITAPGTAVVANHVAVDADGHFAASAEQTTATGSTPVTVSGTFSEGRTSLSIGSDLSVLAVDRTSASAAGYYEASELGAGTSRVVAVSDPDGQCVVAALRPGGVYTGLGSVANGALVSATRADGSSLQVGIDAATGSLVAKGVSGDAAGVSWAGVRDDVPHTDRIANISTRCRVGSADQSLIAGFVVNGSEPRTVLIRAVGPTLRQYGVTGTLTAPHMELHLGSEVLRTADAWTAWPQPSELIDAASRVSAFPLQAGSTDSAVLVTLDPGTYTAVVTGAGGQSGVALVEVYDADAAPSSSSPRIANISSRGQVGVGEGRMIAGFVVNGTIPKRVLIRGVGPTLANYGVKDALVDPVLTLYQDKTVVATNDDWTSQPSGLTAADVTAAADSVYAFKLPVGSHDAVLLITLQPGTYTAQLAGKDDGTGIGLVEVYELGQ